MQIETITKDAFCVIGKAGSTEDGEGFVGRLWADANAHFDAVSDLAVYREDGTLAGIWGAMTDMDFGFLPWQENFTKGRYLAGVEARADAAAPAGWKKWIIPGFTYLKVKAESPDTFPEMIDWMRQQGIPLAAAVQDFTDPATGENFMLFPVAWNDSKQRLIRRIKDTTNPVAVCGMHCEHCFLGQWCGGCRSGCNVCSYATLSQDNVCPNVRCAGERGYDSCGRCPEIRGCTAGFYSQPNADTHKATALFAAAYGEAVYSRTLEKAVAAGMRYCEDLDNLKTIEEKLALLERYRGNGKRLHP